MKFLKLLPLFLIVFFILILVLYFMGAFSKEITLTTYTIDSAKVSGKLRLMLMTDLHCCLYGENQEILMQKIAEAQPDAILLSGDIIDDHRDPANSFLFLEQAVKEYHCYYVTGNHELRTGNADLFKEQMREMGICVLEGENCVFEFNGEKINLCGIDDPSSGLETMQLDAAFSGIDETLYTVLLAHRPERPHIYQNYPADLVVCGHAHGGQWRIPGLLNGFFAPNQGFFPKYAGGLYTFGDMKAIVSRGLDTHRLVPRIFNPPEIVLIEIH
ncbi:MAG: metallophosphoesterase [Christensenellaceae bacterium]|nr:metallophosphoesterase [Christensenellaceae bacterium]